jgi:exodeoxyribonuclease VII large subunit
MNRQAISVSELNKYIKGLMESDYGLKNIFVKGEISNFKLHSSGHMYFTLKDEGSKIKCIMFKFNNAGLKFMPEEGMNVIVFGNISIYERDGQYQLYCSKMEPDGVGGLYLAYEQLKEKLQRQGLFDQAIKKPIPIFPRRIGIATSQTGSVIRDIINVATKRYNKVNLLLYPVKVQGDGAAESIIEAIEYFNTRDDIDVIIIGRGGGSIEELWAFNIEELAYAIRKSKIPVVSAVGHETDFTIADFVADLRASTPSHAAELCVPNYDELKFRITQLGKNLVGSTQDNIKNKRNTIENKVRIVERYSPLNIIAQQIQYIDNLQNKIIYSINNQLTAKKNSFVMLANRIDDLSPIKVIKRGYGYVEKNEQVIETIKKINVGDTIKLHMHDGSAKCRIEEIEEVELW